tara:strand:+ start:2353 stop:3261 length:909 start_codon:yes stop_codon:yes gene_type:complete
MKVLYLSVGNHVDYLCDMILHGFRNLFGADVVDHYIPQYMYESYPQHLRMNLYGRGFTTSCTLKESIGLEVDRNDIENKIKNNYFDIIVYGSIWRSMIAKVPHMYWDLVVNHYDKSDIIMLDGEDLVHLNKNCIGSGLYFKREIIKKSSEVYPISFCIPKEKIFKGECQKLSVFSQNQIGGRQYETEEPYYQSYRDAMFGITTKKGGWDCLRHYEIMMNRCVPYMVDINECPKYSLFRFPKKEVSQVLKMKGIDFENKTIVENQFDMNLYEELNNKIFSKLKNDLTTESMVKYILDTRSKLK